METQAAKSSRAGRLIVNADDWGRDQYTTDRILDCFTMGSISSVSAMVFMEDSERAAKIALDHGIDAGLHLNLDTIFTSPDVTTSVRQSQMRLRGFLRRHRVASILYNPWLAGAFKRVIEAQLQEFERIYRTAPRRIDGHHHMHLCANVLLSGALPRGTIVRRSFTFGPGEKSRVNRYYRELVDRVLTRRHLIADYFFALPPIEANRLRKIVLFASDAIVELETHPTNAAEFQFLASEISRWAGDLRISSGYVL
jgi:predicted glycoside hydrolase/deacetylase ChbG (UPF0249 family)